MNDCYFGVILCSPSPLVMSWSPTTTWIESSKCDQHSWINLDAARTFPIDAMSCGDNRGWTNKSTSTERDCREATRKREGTPTLCQTSWRVTWPAPRARGTPPAPPPLPPRSSCWSASGRTRRRCWSVLLVLLLSAEAAWSQGTEAANILESRKKDRWQRLKYSSENVIFSSIPPKEIF